jgi:hypothetical protein
MFIGPVGEATVVNGHTNGDAGGDLLDAWSAIQASLTGDSFSLCVASYTHTDSHDVAQIIVSHEVGLQRRRLLRTRA